MGISKGNTQSKAYSSGPFASVAFKDIRHRILAVFQSVGLLKGETPAEFDRRFGASEPDFAFASVVRCSLTGWDRKKGHHTADSPNILPAFRPGSPALQFVQNCVDQHLLDLPPRTNVVLLLGNTPAYVSSLRGVLKSRCVPVDTINEVAYRVRGIPYIHLAHPSKMNGHFGSYIRGEGTAGRKRRLAREALDACGLLAGS